MLCSLTSGVPHNPSPLHTRSKTQTDILTVPYTSPSTHTSHVPKIPQSFLLIQVISNPHVSIQAPDSVALPSFLVQYFFTTFNNRNHTFSDCLRIWQNAVQGKVRLLHRHIAMVTCSHVCIMNAMLSPDCVLFTGHWGWQVYCYHHCGLFHIYLHCLAFWKWMLCSVLSCDKAAAHSIALGILYNGALYCVH